MKRGNTTATVGDPLLLAAGRRLSKPGGGELVGACVVPSPPHPIDPPQRILSVLQSTAFWLETALAAILSLDQEQGPVVDRNPIGRLLLYSNG